MMALTKPQEDTLENRPLFFEDFSPGQVQTFGQCEISRKDIIDFASHYDPQPFHIDEQAAKLTMLKGLCASGWHICTVFMRMLDDGLLSRCRSTGINAIDEIQWRIPVRPGDQLSCRITCLSAIPVSEQPGYGLCTFHCEARCNQAHTVMSWWLTLKIKRRNNSGEKSSVSRNHAHISKVTLQQGDVGIKFFEDVQRGDQILLGSYTLSAQRIVTFNKLYGSQPVHPDAIGDRASASGWHMTAIWMRLLVRYYRREAFKLRAAGAPVPELGPSPGIKHLFWHRPVYEDDVVTFSCWAERKVEVTSKPGWGLLFVGIDGRNQDNDRVVSFYALLFLERRKKV